MIRICYFGMYDPEYARNRILIKGLRDNGAEVIICCDRSPFLMKYWRLFVKHARMKNRYDSMVVGFPAPVIMPLARLISSRPIVMDAFLSFYEMNVFDRAVHSPRGFHALWYFFLDWFSCRLADIILVDTDAHGDYFITTFGVPRKKIRRILIGAEMENGELPVKITNNEKFVVHWHGSYIPLQGITYLLRAADLVHDTTIEWHIIGQERPPSHNPRVIFYPWMPFNELREYIRASDLCLGIFGTTVKAKRVIPNKIYEYLSAGKPIITADTPAIREVFNDTELYLIPAGDAVALARAVTRLRENAGLRAVFAKNGCARFLARATPAVLGRELRTILKSMQK